MDAVSEPGRLVDAGGTLGGAIERATRGQRPALVVTIGVDLGKRRDPTAIAVLNQVWRRAEPRFVDRGAAGSWVEPGRPEDHWAVRHLERVALGTSYTDVARRIAEVTKGAAARTTIAPQVYLDATGLGEPILDTLHETGIGAYAGVYGVSFNHGDRLERDPQGHIRLGKAFLVARLQALLEGGRLHLPDLPEARQLAQELRDYEVHIDENANDRYGAFKVGSHDDLVTALGLAVVTGAARTQCY